MRYGADSRDCGAYWDATWVLGERLDHSKYSVRGTVQRLSFPPKFVLVFLTATKHRKEGYTFSICSSVVLPALSKPRNRSLACLLSSPREARTSQTMRIM